MLPELYPPRAELALRPERLGELKGCVAQFKFNDIRTLVIFHPGGEIELLSRRRELHRQYRLTPRMEASLRGLALDANEAHILDGGILRTLRVQDENPIVLWDLLVVDGEYLVGTRYDERYRALRAVCGNPRGLERRTGLQSAYIISPVLWLARNFTDASRFPALFQAAIAPDLVEGLMLKNPGGALEPGFRERNNSRWQFKARKPRGDYAF